MLLKLIEYLNKIIRYINIKQSLVKFILFVSAKINRIKILHKNFCIS